MGKDVIVALDFPDLTSSLNFLDHFHDKKPYVKIGMELFYGEGPEVVRQIKKRGHKVFLDLKLHDIPHTVQRAMGQLRDLGVDMTNLHASGGSKMMAAAKEGLKKKGEGSPLLIAVTQLTSTSQEMMNEELGISGQMDDVVVSYAKNAQGAGLDGVVCSPLEAPAVHAKLGDDFLTVTPGVRFPGKASQDQERVTSPAKAKELGADYIVMGRSITQADDPVAAYDRACREFIG